MSVKLSSNYRLGEPETEIFVGDCREILRKLSSAGVKADLIFADPPFNIGQKYDGYYDNCQTPGYETFMYRWLELCVDTLAPHGSLWVNIPDALAAEVVVYLKNFGLKMINWCVWHYRFGQCNDSKFISSHTHLIYFAKDSKQKTWNPDAILVPSDRASKYNDPRTRQTKRPGMRVPLDVWQFPRIQGNNKERRKGHPNQIPELYMRRVIAACSNEGDLVLDPFLGSGTTSVVARAMNRRSIGIELSEASAVSAFERIKKGAVRV